MPIQNPIRFEELVTEDLVLDGVNASNVPDLLREMAQVLVDKGYCAPGYVTAVLEREASHPSALPMPAHKIAIPHADSTHVHRSAMVFARLRNPVEFRSMGNPEERLQVSMVSMFALKEKNRIGDLLETLITVYQQEEILNAIYDAPDKSAIYRILKENVKRYQSS
jgi:PTS system galactitol-specific IIA component